MNLIIRILLGAITGWLTGKVVEGEGRLDIEKNGPVFDIIFGVVGALIGDYLFFWIVIGKGSAVSDFGTAILGSITAVGAARLIANGLGRVRS